MDEVASEIRRYVLERILPGEDPAQLRDDDQLIDSGILDSLGLVHLVSFLGERFGIDLAPEEITAENFASILVLARFVQSRQGGALR